MLEEDHDQWPDAWIAVNQPNEKIPVEVVSAHQRPPGEDPLGGSAVAKGRQQADWMARKIARTTDDLVVSGTTSFGTPFAFPISSGRRIPAPRTPADPVGWVLAAVRQKMGKFYGEVKKTILVVDFQWMPIPASHFVELSRTLRAERCEFREVWVCNMFNDKAVRVPIDRAS